MMKRLIGTLKSFNMSLRAANRSEVIRKSPLPPFEKGGCGGIFWRAPRNDIRSVFRGALIIILLYSLPAFAGVLPFLPKVFNDLPDNYGITITYITGKQEQFEVASHSLNKDTGTFEFVTKDDVWNWVPISSIQRLEFDKRFSKIVAEKEKEAKKQLESQNKQK